MRTAATEPTHVVTYNEKLRRIWLLSDDHMTDLMYGLYEIFGSSVDQLDLELEF